MEASTWIGGVLIAVGVLDAAVGLAVVVPRARESAQPVLRLAILGAATLLVLLGGAILAGWLRP